MNILKSICSKTMGFAFTGLFFLSCGGNTVSPAYTYLCASNLDCPVGTSCDVTNGVCTASVLPDRGDGGNLS